MSARNEQKSIAPVRNMLAAAPLAQLDHPDFGVTDARDRFVLDLCRGSGIKILALAEPIDAHSGEIAGTAVRAFAHAIAWSRLNDAEALLTLGFTAANAAVLAANDTAGCDPLRRHFIGFSAAVVTEWSTSIAVAPPGHAAVVRGSVVATVGFDEHDGEARPLGTSAVPRLRRMAVPTIPTSIVALSTRAARSDLQAIVVAAGGSFAPTSSAANPDGLRIVVAASTAELVGRRPAQRTAPVAPVAFARADHQTRPGLRDTAIAWSERTLGARRRDRWLSKPVPLGSRSVERYQTRFRFDIASAIRTRVPRMPRIPISGRSFLAFLLVAVLLIGAGLGYNVRQARAAKQDQLLTLVRNEIEAARQASSPEGAESHLSLASSALTSAAGAGVGHAVLENWRSELTSARDATHGVGRLQGIQRLGALPTDIASDRATLALIGNRLLLVCDSIYEVSTQGEPRTMTPILAVGSTVAGREVRPIVNVTSDNGRLIATDGFSLFRLDANEAWTAIPLAPAEGGRGWRGDALGSFDGNLYLLDRSSNQILKFGIGHLTDAPTSWISGDSADFGSATDMVVDGSIRVLHRDGTLQTFYRGIPERTQSVTFGETASTPIALYGDSTTSYLYVLERIGDRGRLVRLDRDSADAAQFLAPDLGSAEYDPAARAAIRNATSFAVSEADHVFYVIADGVIWAATIPS